MAQSYINYTGDGSVDLFNVTFPYINRDHVFVYVDGEETPFEFFSTGTIRLDPAPADGAVVRVERQTPSEPIVDFENGTNLTAQELDMVSIQSLYLSQEGKDVILSTLRKDLTGVFAAGGLRIIGVADPVNPQDAVTKRWAETAMTSQLSKAKTAATEAEDASDTAAQRRDAAQAAAGASEDAAQLAEDAEDGAVAARDTATNAAQSAQAARDEASGFASTASGSANMASTARDQAVSARDQARGARDDIVGLTPVAETLAPNEPASAGWDASTGKLSLGIPRGEKGEKGEGINTREPVNYLSGYDISRSQTINVPSGEVFDGRGSRISTRAVADKTDGIEVYPYSHLSDLTLDMGSSETQFDGQAINMIGSGSSIEDVTVTDFGSYDEDSPKGCGVISPSSQEAEKLRLRGLTLVGNKLAKIVFGWVLSNTRSSFVSEVLARKINSYAHELKNNSKYNMLHALITEDSNVALAYGQQGNDGADKNIAMGSLGAGVDGGVRVGWGNYNLFSSGLYEGNETRQYRDGWLTNDRAGILMNEGNRNMFTDHLLTGTFEQAADIRGDSNYVEFGAYCDIEDVLVEFQPGSNRNFVNVMHLGHEQSKVEDAIRYNGTSLTGYNANVVHSPLSGERIGSTTGRFHDKLGESGAGPNSNHGWYKEGDTHSLTALMTQRGDKNIAGWTVEEPGDDAGRFWYVYGDTPYQDHYEMGVGRNQRVVMMHNDFIYLNELVGLPVFTVDTLPTPRNRQRGAICFVNDGGDGEACLAVWGGGNWRRITFGSSL